MTGLSALDPTVARAQQQIEQQKMKPDQAVNFLLSKGVDPRLASLVMKYRLLKQAAGAQGQQTPPKTVSQEIDEQVNQMAAQRNRGSGVAALPVPSQMFGSSEPAQGMARGGIVSFAKGGGNLYEDMYADSAEDITDTVGGWGRILGRVGQRAMAIGAGGMGEIPPGVAPPQAQPPQAAAPNAAPPSPAPTGAFPAFPKGPFGSPFAQNADAPAAPPPPAVDASSAARMGMRVGTGIPASQQAQFDKQNALVASQAPQSIEQIYNNLDAMAQKQGIGAAADAHLGYLDSLGGQLAKLQKQGKWGALAQAGFAMAQAATQNPRGGFLGALAVGGQKAGELYQQDLEKYRDLSMRLNEQKYQVQKTLEDYKNDRTKASRDDHNEQVRSYDSLLGRTQAAQDAAASRTMSRDIANMTVAAQAKYRSLYDPRQLIMEEIHSNPVGSSKYNDAITKLTDINSTQPGVLAAGVHADASTDARRAALYASQGYSNLVTQSMSSNPDRAKAAKDRLAEIERSFGPNGNPQGPNQPSIDLDLSQWGDPRQK